MALPNNYLTQGAINANFSFTDFVQGASYLKLYTCTALNNSSEVIFMTQDTTLTPESTSTSGGGEGQDTTVNFDYEITNTIVFQKGKAYCYLGFIQDEGGATFTSTIYVSLYHYDGSTETQIGDTTSAAYVSNGASIAKDMTVQFDVDSQVVFGTGDFIRLKVRVVNTDPAGIGGNILLRTDPTSSSSTWVSVPIKFEVST